MNPASNALPITQVPMRLRVWMKLYPITPIAQPPKKEIAIVDIAKPSRFEHVPVASE